MNRNLRILLLAGNTLRARAYAQYLAHYQINIEVEGLFFGFKEKTCSAPILNKETESYLYKNNLFIPDLSETLHATFNNNNWNYGEVNSIDVNSIEVIQAINTFTSDIVIFAGYGGQLLKELHFKSKKKYLHMHPGKLPIERGSTTLYYSILNERNLTVTAFFMTEKIDSGEIVMYQEYMKPQKNVDIDRWLDNVIRADCLRKSISKISAKETFDEKYTSPSEEFYIIHPVLKHIALLSLA